MHTGNWWGKPEGEKAHLEGLGVDGKTILKWIYNRLIINNDSQKHNYICKYNNLPTTCFGLIRPCSGWNTASEENYLFDLNASGKGGRDLVYNLKMAELGRNM